MQTRDNNRLAIFSIVSAMLMMSFGDAIIKSRSADFSLWQLYALRSLLTLPVLLAVMKWRRNRLSLMPLFSGWTTLRSLMLTLTWALYYAALPHVHLSVAAAVLYTSPLFITLFSALLIGEKISRQSWLAVFLGFSGVLVIVRPAAAEFNIHALLPMASAILYALAMIITRTKSRYENPLILSLSMNILFIVVGVAASLILLIWQPTAWAEADSFLFGPWRPINASQWFVMSVLAAAILMVTIFAAYAYQIGAPPLVATFEYTYLGFIIFWGFVFFVEIPDLPSTIGMLMIAAAGLLIARQPAAPTKQRAAS